MPPTLHPYLKQGLDFNASPPDPSDLVEDRPTEHHDTQDDSAKRRRIEAVALQCLQGRPPLILTARLKGPFDKDWKNPWAPKDNEGQGGSREARVGQAQARPKRRSKASQVASPEASRAAGHTEEQLYSPLELEPLPATAPIPDDEDHSGGTEFFSVDTENFIANNSETNPFWLRRPAANISFPANSQTDGSPSRICKRDHRYSSRKSLQPAPPKEPLGGRQLPIRATPPDEWRSSASASMDISLVIKPAAAIKHQVPEQSSPHTCSAKDVPNSPRLREDSAQEEEARSSQAAHYVQIEAAAETPISLLKNSAVIFPDAQIPQPSYAQSFDTFVPATTYKMPSTVQVPQSSPKRGAVIVGSQIRPSREDIQGSAECLTSSIPKTMSKQELPSIDITVAKGSGLHKKQRHDQVASPAPYSSTGFVYRRIGQPKNEIGGLQKTKPRAVSFSSSSPPNKKAKDPPGAMSETIAPVAETEVLENLPPNVAADATEATVVQQLEDEVVIEEEEQQKDDQQESYKWRQSQYSTQAAMLLAQLEFQEDSSQSSILSATLRPWSQPAQNTPLALLPQPSPAITPVSVFNARTDLSFSDLAGNGVLDGPPISTQDLFNAASPFAFSTVKKKSERPRPTSMRFALTRLNESQNIKNPTPLAERVPLKEKNTTKMWSFTHEKSCMDAPKPTLHSSQRTTNDVELPQLDFHTSLDFGPNADFTDYFLKGLDNEP